MMWSKVKNTLRSAEARTESALTQAIGAALAMVTRQDAINWFTHCGYSIIYTALVWSLIAVSLIGPLAALFWWRTAGFCSRKGLNCSGIGRARKIF